MRKNNHSYACKDGILDTEEGAGGSGVTRKVWGRGWDCAGQRLVTEPHSENGPIVLLSTVLDRHSGRQLWLNLLGVTLFVGVI